MKNFLSCLIVFTVMATVTGENIPDFLKICKRSDPNPSGCVINSVNHLKPYLVTGLPEYDIPSLEPIELGEFIIAGSKTDQGLLVTAKDIKAYGASNWNLKNLKVVEFASKYSFQIELPHLYVVGRYNVDGRILIIPLQGAGQFKGNFTGCTANVRIKGIQKQINGQTHLVPDKLDIKITLENGQIHLDNLFGGDKALGQIINKAINENFLLLSQDMIPLIEKSLAKVFKKTATKIHERFTLAQLYPQT